MASTGSDLTAGRYFLKDTVRLHTDFSATDQSRGVPAPSIEKPFSPEAKRVALPAREQWEHVGSADLADAMGGRRSRRRYKEQPIHLDELAFLLWATQGICKGMNAGTALRTVPSAGARHAFETYLCVLNVDALDPGVYRYLPIEHELVHVSTVADLPGRLADGTLGQAFVGHAAVTFVWTAIPYRMEWRYGPAAHKVIALDAGHVCQNLYLACEAIGAGTCAIAAYDQEAMDRLLGVDGKDEFTVYLAPVGKV
jgi:SagB-type dehydrogenase family enzyme